VPLKNARSVVNDFKNISSVYFLGIGGIGMSALARYFKSIGLKVSGYDKTETELTKLLVKEGIHVHYQDNVSLIDMNAGLFVYTPAIPPDHKEYNHLLKNGYAIMKRSEVLGLITQNTYSICVAGTHGKTTTSSMIAHILRHSEFGCNAFLGGIASNYNTNFWSNEKNVSVAEADEYDRSFLKLRPDVAVVTSMDADHLDIYGTAENLQEAFVEFTSRIKKDGLLIYKSALPRSNEFKTSNRISYSLQNKDANAAAENIKIDRGSYQFDVRIKDSKVKDVVLNMGGMHNIENAVAAITVAKYVGIEDKKIIDAVAAFKGVKRRFEYIIKEEGMVMIDDYAHHPEELRALINGARELFPGKKCTIIFQPHLFSRTRDFADGFAAVLSLGDDVLLLPIYPARESPIAGVTSEMIAAKMKNKRVEVLSKEELLDKMKKTTPELLIICGAGDIDALVTPIKNILVNKKK
jgi:UDP-N-acetylmuramate--alanine ligase